MGYSVQPFKAGPDYIDPGHLAAAAGIEAHNLDAWIMGRSGVAKSFSRNANRDISVIEGVMGYYDGLEGNRNLASTHHIAQITGSPVILVVDARGAARSVAATILGFIRFSAKSGISAIILNNIGSSRHKEMCVKAIAPLGVPVVGVIPRNPDIALKSRHLGLAPATHDMEVQKDVMRQASFIMDHLDMAHILHLAKSAEPIKAPKTAKVMEAKTRIGVALDGSFNFYYKDNLERLRNSGAEIHLFSPETGSLPEVDGLYIGGGFPEVRGDILQNNDAMLHAIKKIIQDGAPTYAECGGLMYLAKDITHDGKKFRMTGIFDVTTVMKNKATLGYTQGIMSEGPLVTSHATFRGHEFHYSALEGVSEDSRFAQELSMGTGIIDGKDGIISHEAMASYGHLYLGKGMAQNMIHRCVSYSRR